MNVIAHLSSVRLVSMFTLISVGHCLYYVMPFSVNFICIVACVIVTYGIVRIFIATFGISFVRFSFAFVYSFHFHLKVFFVLSLGCSYICFTIISLVIG